MAIVVIADIVGSRGIPDRAAAQRDLEAALARVASAIPGADSPLTPIVGDELQGIYPDLASAVATTLLLRLTLPEQVDCRFGVGIGDVEAIPSAGPALSEGPAWWAAREAIETVEGLARRTVPSARTWVGAAEGATSQTLELVRLTNAGLLARDSVIARMTSRTRRLTFGRCLDHTQRELAEAEGITQSAVSQALTTAEAAALVEGYRALRG